VHIFPDRAKLTSPETGLEKNPPASMLFTYETRGSNHLQSQAMRWTPLHPRHAHPRQGRARFARRRVPESEILADFPYLQTEDIRACLEYAAQGADHPVLVLTES
jgi:hypothetical protein